MIKPYRLRPRVIRSWTMGNESPMCWSDSQVLYELQQLWLKRFGENYVQQFSWRNSWYRTWRYLEPIEEFIP